MAARFKAWACGRSLAGTAGSNPAGGMGACVVCCTVRTNGKNQDNRDKEVRLKYNESEISEGKIRALPLLFLWDFFIIITYCNWAFTRWQ